MSGLAGVHPVFFLIIATILEVSGDAIVRLALYNHPNAGLIRAGLFVLGAGLVFGYVGLYIATLFLVWQVINFAFFGTLPTVPILIGGTMIVAGGLIVTFWAK